MTIFSVLALGSTGPFLRAGPFANADSGLF
jgi:hypothetical protein